MTAQEIQITIHNKTGNKVKYEYYNDGSRGRLDESYRPRWRAAKFRLPSGKSKNEVFPNDFTDEQILASVSKKYSNLKFALANRIN